jgi:Chaperone of endosialidase/Head domain of trimeric autotransporter adhesin
MKKLYLLLSAAFFVFNFSFAQNVGIGTTTPLARLHVTDSNVVFSASGDIPVTPGITPINGGGRRMLWYPDKAAFRVGYASAFAFNSEYIGNYSFAAGINSLALGTATTSFGNFCKAGGAYSVAMGNNCSTNGISSVAIGENNFVNGNYAIGLGLDATASGINSISIGSNNQATAYASTAMGYQSTASGNYSTAMGYQSTASGYYSTAIGGTASGFVSMAMGPSIASGNYSTAMGTNTIASGGYSTSMGSYVSTNNKSGSFIIGDKEPNASPSQMFGNDADNQMLMRFVGGYKLYTAGYGFAIGAQLTPGATSWSAVSDKRKKENFVSVNAESILQKISSFNLTTWNYKTLDVKTQRHYGPMAQDFYAAFGNDALGKIGCDTLINEHDFSSINFIAIQALEKRTQKIEQQQQQIIELQKTNAALQQQNEKLFIAFKKLNQQVQVMAKIKNETGSSSLTKNK